MARLDQSYGVGGVVDLDAEIVSWRSQIRVARNGAAYALAGAEAGVLYRYSANGSPDRSFGESNGTYQLPQEARGSALEVDSAGRPLLAKVAEGRLAVRRLTSDGRIDRTFGDAGVVEFKCPCGAPGYRAVYIAPGRGGSATVIVTAGLYSGDTRSSSERVGTVFRLLRFRADGSPDSRFGGNGVATFSLRGVDGIGVRTAPTPGGGLYLATSECCETPPVLARVSRRGRLDRHFLATSGRSLGILRRLASPYSGIASVQVRRGGKIDLVGSRWDHGGFVLRLRPNGQRFRRYSEGGLRALPMSVEAAVAGDEGSPVVLTKFAYLEGRRLYRILPGGRIDPAFGSEGTRVTPRASGEELSLDALSRRRLVVSTTGVEFCRVSCPPAPAIARYLEPRRRHR